MNPWILVATWCGIGMLAMSWFWYEGAGNVRRPLIMRLTEVLLGPILWPLATYSAWIWSRSRLRRLDDFRRTGTPHCRRHGSILLKCEEQHDAFCSACSGGCGTCGKDAWFSPRYHGRSEHGEHVNVYEAIYAEHTKG